MKLDEFASDASQALRVAVAKAETPDLVAVRRSRRRRSGLLAGGIGVLATAVVLGLVALSEGSGPTPPATSPTTTRATGGTHSYRLLDGSTVRIISSVALDISGFSFVLEHPELGGERFVEIRHVDNPAVVAATEQAFHLLDVTDTAIRWRANRQGQPLFLSVDLGAWVVFLNVGNEESAPSTETLLRVADLLTGPADDDGVFLPNHKPSSFEVEFSAVGEEGLVIVRVGDCFGEFVSGSEVVEDPQRGTVIRTDQYASWCRLTPRPLETVVHGPSDFVDEAVASLEVQIESPATVVSELGLEIEVPLRVLAIRPNNPSLAVLDFEEGTLTVYPPGSHALPRDATDGAVMTPNREFVIWTQGVARLFTGSLDRVDLVLGPHPPRDLPDIAPSLRVVPSPAGDKAWLVQPGIGNYPRYPTLIELVEIRTGRRLQQLEADPDTFPIAATNHGLVLNAERLVDTGDGLRVEPGSERVLQILEDGSVIVVGPGRAIAASGDTIARLVCPSDQPACEPYRTNELVLSNPDGTNRRLIEKPSAGTWLRVGGPSIPSGAMPLATVAPDGSKLLVSLGRSLDVNGTPANSTLLAIDLDDGGTNTIAEFEGATPLATWSSDSQWIALFWGRDIQLIGADDPDTKTTLVGVIPEEHFPLAAG